MRIHLNWRYLAGTAIVIIAVASTITLSRLSQAAGGKIVYGRPAQTNEFSVSLSPKEVSDKYASFDYPSGMSPQPTQQLNSPLLAEFLFKALDIQSWMLAVDIINNPTTNIANSSSYMIRSEDPADYQKSYFQIGRESVLVMTYNKASGFSKVAYLEKANLLATISLVGDDPQGTHPLQSAFAMVLSSWRWQ